MNPKKTYFQLEATEAPYLLVIQSKVMEYDLIENRKMLLENRIYVLNMCKVIENCAYKSTADLEIDKTKREIDDIRSHLSSLKRKDLEYPSGNCFTSHLMFL